MAEQEERGAHPEENGEVGESNAARVLRLREGSVEPEAKTEDRRTLRERLSDFWYYHRWVIIIGGIFLVLLVIATVQLTSKRETDLYVMYAGPAYVGTSATRAVTDGLAAVMEDRNGDGRKDTMLYALVYQKGMQNAGTARTQFTTEFSSGDSVLYFLSPDVYAVARETDSLVPLTEIFGETPAGAVDGYGIALGSLPFYEEYLIVRTKDEATGEVLYETRIFPEDTVVCLRRPPLLTSLRASEKAQRLYEAHLAFLRLLVGWGSP